MADFEQFDLTPNIRMGGDRPVIIAGPCAIETLEISLQSATFLRDLAKELNLPYVFKSSFDKANRTSDASFRSIGFKPSLDILKEVKREIGVPILTDVHELDQMSPVAAVADVLQIPAFLCRQTDLIQEAGRSGLPVNLKKGQFISPEDMVYAVEKIHATGNNKVFVTERGASFGYHNLVVDMRSFPIMRKFAPVVFDATHSVQMPGSAGGSTGGKREFAPYLARAAAAVGVDGFFIETHPNPGEALSDGPNMMPLMEMPTLLKSIVAVWDASRPFLV